MHTVSEDLTFDYVSLSYVFHQHGGHLGSDWIF